MSDDEQRTGDPDEPGAEPRTDDDVDYWLRRARRLQAAKRRRLGDKFRRDSGDDPPEG